MTRTHPVIGLEKAALARWCSGDPSGFLELSAPDVTYFDPFLPARLDGLEKLTAYYGGIRGKISAPRYEMIDPHVTEIGDAAILTFRFVSFGGSEGAEMRWNCTEVYRREGEDWRIVQTHWSLTGGS
ncbi:MAG: nuclear transport factor 2 family protein [Notoacmeibacter sp.]|nr:nuclear transport factor 2 family protein [Notoacmeibacter sp.]